METVVETPNYLAAAKAANMTETEMELAVLIVAGDPLAGDLIAGTGGCRKVRMAGKGKGKSGGYRLITFYRVGQRVYLLSVFAKADRMNLTAQQRNELKAVTALL